MIVCNMVVVGTYIYRVFWSPSDEDCTSEPERVSDDDDFTTPVPRRSENLTTVDLGLAMTGLTESASEVSFIRPLTRPC